MEKLTTALLNSVLTPTGGQLQRQLSSSDGLALTVLMEGLARRYPSQDTSDAMQEYMTDYGQLVLKFSLQKVQKAVAALRIDPDQSFFPRPDEVAREIQRQRLKNVPSHLYARG